MSSIRVVPLCDILYLDRDEVIVDVNSTYQTVGVRSFGRGLFERPPVSGTDTSYKRLFRLGADQIVLSRLFAWEGAVAQVTPEFEGMFASPEFPSFSVDHRVVDASYIGHYIRWPDFHAQLASTRRGLGQRRQRVSPEDLLAVKIRLPHLDEQRRAVARLDSVRTWFEGIWTALPRGAGRIIDVLPDLVDGVVQAKSDSSAPVSSLARFVSDIIHPGEDPSPADRFVGLQHIEGHTGRRLGSEALGLLKGRKFRFRPGDVVYGYLRPYLNKVWVADCHGLCSVDQYVLRPRGGVCAEILGHSLRGRAVLSSVIDRTHSLQLPRLRSGLLGATEVPVVPEVDAQFVVRRLSALRDLAVTVERKRHRQMELATNLLPSALYEEFGGRR